MSKTKLPLSRISSAASVSALFTFAVIFSASIFLTPSTNPPVWRAVGGTSWLIKRRSSKPCCECWAPSSLFEQGSYSATFPPFDANRVVGHRWLHNGKQPQCILGPLLGHKWQLDQVCLKYRVHQQMAVVAICVWIHTMVANAFRPTRTRQSASARKLLCGCFRHTSALHTRRIADVISNNFTTSEETKYLWSFRYWWGLHCKKIIYY